MEVLIVTPFFPYEPGRPYAGIFVGDQVLSLRQLGTRPRVVTFVPWTPWPTPIARERWRVFSRIPRQYSWKDIAVEARRYPVLPHNMGLGIASWAMERVLFQHCVRSQPDLIHAHFAYPTGLAAVRAGARHGVPVVLTVHGSDIHKLPSLSRRCKKGVVQALAGAARVLAVSESLRQAVLELCPTAEVIVHRIGRDLSRFRYEEHASVDRTAARELLDLGGLVVLYVGNLLREKGVMELLEVFRGLEDVGARLVYVGDGPLAQDLALRADALGLGERVRLLGARPPELIPGLLAAADVLVLPSYREGLGMVCVEALACGTPVVATNVGGIPEVIRHMETGLVVPPGDVAALADALRWVLVNKAAARRLAQAGRSLVERYHDLEANTRQLLEIYRDVL